MKDTDMTASLRSSPLLAALSLAAAALISTAAQASPLLVDRGLPSANLNNASGANRSNVAWTDGGYVSTSDYWLVGDTFTNTSGQSWHIDTIRMWTVGSTSTTSLWGGLAGGSIAVVSSAGAIAGPMTYADTSTYQGSSGSLVNMFQVDFAVDITLAAGDTYEFYLDGTGGTYVVPFAHASNAALSGTPQDGADGLMLGGQVVGGLFDTGTRYTWTSQAPGVWDKTSDINVQVMGNAIPEPASLALVAIGLLGAGLTRRRRA
jgi:hypothetical protein